jgi:hypothetical protein
VADGPGKAPLFPPRDWWMPAVPLVVLTVFLSAVVDFRSATLDFLGFDFDARYLEPTARDYTHLGDLLVYCAIAGLHVFVCLGVIAFFIHAARSLPARERARAGIYLALGAAMLFALVLAFGKWANEIVLVQLGFKATCLAIDGAKLATHLVEPGTCFIDGNISRLTWLAWIPTFAGMGAVLFAAA